MNSSNFQTVLSFRQEKAMSSINTHTFLLITLFDSYDCFLQSQFPTKSDRRSVCLSAGVETWI